MARLRPEGKNRIGTRAMRTPRSRHPDVTIRKVMIRRLYQPDALLHGPNADLLMQRDHRQFAPQDFHGLGDHGIPLRPIGFDPHLFNQIVRVGIAVSWCAD
jgi:hypothetical protein